MAFKFPGSGLPNWQEMDRDIDRYVQSQLPAPKLTLATLPDPASWEGRTIRVTDEVGGDTLAWSDGTNWRRTPDNVIVS